MAITVSQSGRRFSRWAAAPAENITRQSTRRSAAVAVAEPMAIPKSMELKVQGVFSGFWAQAGCPQYPQLSPIGDDLVPMRTIAPACLMFSASRSKNGILFTVNIACIFFDSLSISLSVRQIVSIMSMPRALGAVRAAVIMQIGRAHV